MTVEVGPMDNRQAEMSEAMPSESYGLWAYQHKRLEQQLGRE